MWPARGPAGPPPAGRRRPRLVRPVRVVAGGAGERVRLLVALALPQVLALVGHVVLLGVLRLSEPVILVERLARPVRQGRAAGLGVVSVALGADFHKPLARQRRRVEDGAGGSRFRVSLVELDVLLARPVAALARHPEDERVGP